MTHNVPQFTVLEFTGEVAPQWRRAYMLVSNIKYIQDDTIVNMHYTIGFSFTDTSITIYSHKSVRKPIDTFYKQSEQFKPDITGKSRIIDFCFTRKIKA